MSQTIISLWRMVLEIREVLGVTSSRKVFFCFGDKLPKYDHQVKTNKQKLSVYIGWMEALIYQMNCLQCLL